MRLARASLAAYAAIAAVLVLKTWGCMLPLQVPASLMMLLLWHPADVSHHPLTHHPLTYHHHPQDLLSQLFSSPLLTHYLPADSSVVVCRTCCLASLAAGSCGPSRTAAARSQAATQCCTRTCCPRVRCMCTACCCLLLLCLVHCLLYKTPACWPEPLAAAVVVLAVWVAGPAALTP